MYKAASALFFSTTVIFCGLWLTKSSAFRPDGLVPSEGEAGTRKLKSDLALAKAEAEKLRKERDALMITSYRKSATGFPGLSNGDVDESFYVGDSPAHERLQSLIESMRKTELEQEKESLGQDLNRLYSKLNLSGEEKDRLDALILERRLLRQNARMTGEYERLETDLATADKDIETLLGSRYAVLQDFRDKHEAYSRLDNLNEELGEQQLPTLTDDKVESLASLITETLKAPYSIDIEAKGGWRKLSESERQIIVEERQARTARITQSSGLSPEQQEILKDHLRWRGGR
ncbi:MAG: hypothetical protein RL095_2308 [Verrucomicrobiota bacterium]